MITRTYINGDIAVLKTVLESTGFFESVEYNDPDTPTSVILKDAESHTLGVIGANTITAYISAGTAQTVTFNVNCKFNTAYVCPGGTMIEFRDGTTRYAALMLTKTSDERVAFIFSQIDAAAQAYRLNSYKSVYSIVWGGTVPVAYYPNLPQFTHSQTVLVPFPVNSPEAHTVTAFFTAFGSYYTNEYLEFTLNGENYFTNGYWAIKDDEVTA